MYLLLATVQSLIKTASGNDKWVIKIQMSPSAPSVLLCISLYQTRVKFASTNERNRQHKRINGKLTWRHSASIFPSLSAFPSAFLKSRALEQTAQVQNTASQQTQLHPIYLVESGFIFSKYCPLVTALRLLQEGLQKRCPCDIISVLVFSNENLRNKLVCAC